MITRCSWANFPEGATKNGCEALYEKYHDDEWGVPVHDDHHFFEMITLEGAQAGLSWITVLRKREAYRKAFAGFDPKKVARFDQAKIDKLVLDEGIIRHRGKIESTVSNARVFLAVQKEFGSFDAFIWSFVGGKIIVADPKRTTVLTRSPESDTMSKALKKRGFKFVGTTICYAFMQACGLVSDHQRRCFKAP